MGLIKEKKNLCIRDFSLKVSNLPRDFKEKDIYTIAHYLSGLVDISQPKKVSCSLFFNDSLDNLLNIENIKTTIRELYYEKFHQNQTLREIKKINKKIKGLVTKINNQSLIIRKKLKIPFETNINFFGILNQPVTSIIITLQSTQDRKKLFKFYKKVSINHLFL